MARSLFWKETVALSALAIFVCSFQSAISQSHTNSITYTCKNSHLESVFEFLSSTSGYDFIYSSNLVDVTQPVSLSVANKPIGEVLRLIEKQVNITFRVQDRYIVVKAIPKEAPSVGPVIATQPLNAKSRVKSPPSLRLSDSLLMSSVSKTLPLQPSFSHKSMLQSRLDKRITELQELLGPGVPRKIPPMYVNRVNINNRHSGWFASVGTFVSDYSTGLELQAGLRYVYAVVQPRWSQERGFYGIYGVGNSLMLMRNFSFNTIYMYSGYTTSESVYPYSSPVARLGPEFQLTQTTRHHQVKFAVQYALSKNFTVRAGPVLNYQTFFAELVPVNIAPVYEGTVVYRQSGSQQTDVVYQNGQFTSSTFRTAKSWLGWEGAISYRINFFPRR